MKHDPDSKYSKVFLALPWSNEIPDLGDLMAGLSGEMLRNNVDFVGLRRVTEKTHWRGARNGKPDRSSVNIDIGIMVEVVIDGALAYCGTTDQSIGGLKLAFNKGVELAKASRRRMALEFSPDHRPKSQGKYFTNRVRTLEKQNLRDWTDYLCHATQTMQVSDKIVTAVAEGMFIECKIEYLSSFGAMIEQDFLLINSHFSATAQYQNESQTRSLWGQRGLATQSGLEAFTSFGTDQQLKQVGNEAIQLLLADNCPNGKMDLILLPHQMYMQIHESVGHPLELDRILGDERNFAGWSFIRPTDFGQLKYGSELMNVSFDPGVSGEFASYCFDDSGAKAGKESLIENGILRRGLGGLESQARIKLPGVANFRAASWNRAPIDRMANINLEPGPHSLEEMITNTENGILMESNVSWSIDDFRNKFQFGCEVGYLIKNGKRGPLVKNPNYRDATISFWNKLKMVGNENEVQVMGSPWCGKGEPSQVIRVGHSSPPCLFSDVEVFGGGT